MDTSFLGLKWWGVTGAIALLNVSSILDARILDFGLGVNCVNPSPDKELALFRLLFLSHRLALE